MCFHCLAKPLKVLKAQFQLQLNNVLLAGDKQYASNQKAIKKERFEITEMKWNHAKSSFGE